METQGKEGGLTEEWGFDHVTQAHGENQGSFKKDALGRNHSIENCFASRFFT